MTETIETLIDRLTTRQRHEFALACARRVQHLMRDPRSIAALDTRERWLRGEATDAEMYAAWAAADAAWDAAFRRRAAAAWAASAATWVASAAPRPALAAAAAAAAAGAARATASASELAWQREELRRMLAEGGGA